jgi:ribosomal protein L29
MTNMKDIRTKSEAEITTLVSEAREALRTERFKDKFARKASVIKNAKKEVARALTELTARRSNPETK